MRLLAAARADLAALLAALLSHFAREASRGAARAPHSRRPVRILTLHGWVEVTEPCRPGEGSALRDALGVGGGATPAARAAIARCGAPAGSFREAAQTLRGLTAVTASAPKVRSATLAEGARAHALPQNPRPGSGIRAYGASPPPGGVTRTGRTLVAMAGGGGAPCSKADTRGVPGKNGEAGTRQIRAAPMAEYEWLDARGRPVLHPGSQSYLVCGGDAAALAPALRRHGLARGSGTAARVHAMADGEPALEKALRDAFPRALFTNDFYHAGEHLHACLAALLPDAAARAKEYRLCRGLLFRLGAASVVGRLRRGHARRLAACPEAQGRLEHLDKRKGNMRYGMLRKAGLHIGTGHMEAAIRVLIVRRLKQAGMHWRHANAIHVAALHAQYRSRKTA